ncbi:hypothetical protein D3C77_666100 [compost metagenome]
MEAARRNQSTRPAQMKHQSSEESMKPPKNTARCVGVGWATPTAAMAPPMAAQ